MRITHRGFAAALGAVGSLMLLGPAAQAADNPPCGTLPANAIVLTGSTALAPLVASIAGPLLATGDIDLYFTDGVGSCAGAGDVVAGTEYGTKAAKHYAADGTATLCALPAGTKPTMAFSDVFMESCSVGKVAGFVDISGPASAMVFAAPKLSTQKVLVAEEGYFVFGFGTAGYMGQTVAPWVNQMAFAIRDAGSGTQTMTSLAVGLPSAASMRGTNAMGSTGVINTLNAANGLPTTAEPAIGILGAPDYDKHRDTLKALAFQGFGQTHAYYPDSTATSTDKRNVRDGHYLPWGPVHMIAPGDDAQKKPTNARVANLVEYINGVKPLPGVKIIDVLAGANIIPQCAMKVTRTKDLGDLKPYTPAAGTACGCYFDKLKNGATSCKVCTADAECGALKCSNGYCE